MELHEASNEDLMVTPFLNLFRLLFENRLVSASFLLNLKHFFSCFLSNPVLLLHSGLMFDSRIIKLVQFDLAFQFLNRLIDNLYELY